MILVIDKDPEILRQWIERRIRLHIPAFDVPRDAQCIGIADDQRRLLGVAAFYNYSPRFQSIEVAFAADDPRAVTRAAIRAILSYPFRQLGCARVTSIVPKRLRHARRFNERLGFVLEGVARRGFLRDDAMIYGLLAEEAEHWLGPAEEMKGAA